MISRFVHYNYLSMGIETYYIEEYVYLCSKYTAIPLPAQYTCRSIVKFCKSFARFWSE